MSARRMLRWLLVAQACAAAAVAVACTLWLGWTPWAALACGLGAVVLARLAINMNNFLLSACFASPTPEEYRLGARARLRLLGEEFVSSMLNSSWFMPRASGCRRIHPDSRALPVLLVHGYGCNSGYWSYLIARLDARAISHAGIDLEPVGGAIDDYVPTLERAVDELCAATGAPQVAIVAHSMGGLVARAWMRVHGSTRLARLVTLGTPHHGTALASFGPGANAAQMRRSRGEASAWLRALADSEDAARRALVTSIFSHHDNIISPQTSSVLDGARNIALGGVGHVALGCNGRVLDTVMAELDALAGVSSVPVVPNAPPEPPTLLLVDDDPFMLELLRVSVDEQGWRVLTAASGEEALALLAHAPVAAIVSDHLMPGMHGAQLLAEARRVAPASVRILLSGAQDDAAIAAALARGDAHHFLSKPWRAEALQALLRAAQVNANARSNALRPAHAV